MRITRRFTKPGQDVLNSIEYEKRDSRIANPDGTVVFEMKGAEIPKQWSQLAADIMVSKYFRKAGVPQLDATGQVLRDEKGNPITGPERSVKQVVHRLAGCWRFWAEKHNYFSSPEDAQAFYDEIAHMLLHQVCAPNSPQWFNTGLHWAYGITGPAQGHYYCDPETGEVKRATDAYSRPQPHACFIQSVRDDLVGEGGIMDLWTREARLFKYGSGTGSNYSKLRGENEPLSGGGKSSGLMSFLRIGDRCAGAIKSGGTTRRAAKMVCLDLDHPDIEAFVNWKVREEIKVAAMAEGLKRLSPEQQKTAQRLKLKLDYDFNGEAYQTVSGQNANNSVRIPNSFFRALQDNADWNLIFRTNGKVAHSLPARELWDQVAFSAWRCADPGVQFDDTINQWHTCPKDGRINASNPCVTGDTRVLCADGVWRRIDRMLYLPANVVTNVPTEGRVERVESHPIEGAFPTGRREVIELLTEDGYRVNLTPDHKVWTRHRGWVPAAHLADDFVALPADASGDVTAEPRDPQLFQMLGLLVSSSNVQAGDLSVARALPLGEAREALETYLHAETGPESASSAQSQTAVRVSTGRLMARLRSLVSVRNGHSVLSDEVFAAGLAVQKHVLRALFTADAVLVGSALSLAGSHELLEDIQTLLLGFGVRASLRHVGSSASLSVHPDSMRAFNDRIGLLPGAKAASLEAIAAVSASPRASCHWSRVASLKSKGTQGVFDLTEPVTQSFVAQGISVHNCSEYMFLDDTACNLASLNLLTFFDSDSRQFDIEAFRHAVRLWTIVLEASVLMASFPSEKIAELSYQYRTLGLGFANLGAMLMQAGIAYDSDKARAICGAVSAILTGEAYSASSEMAAKLGTFSKYENNREDVLRVLSNHRRAAYDVARNPAARRQLGDYDQLDIHPVGIDGSCFEPADPLVSPALLHAARESWDRAVASVEQHGARNAQVSVIAPTGTIGLLMDCDTTGVEPDYALVKFKKLAGGGYFKIANQSLRPALVNLNYHSNEISEILRYVMGTLSFEGSPHINTQSLKSAGFTDDEIDQIEDSLPGVFELSHAFVPASLGKEALARLGVAEEETRHPGFNLLERLGFTRKQIQEAADVICGRGTIEGAPHLRPEHLSVFDCASRCGRIGQRFIAVEGHIRMMAACQPFISGAISKTINLPREAVIDDIKNSYLLSWKLGLKANALYRDGSKLSQPLNSSASSDQDEKDDADEVQSAREEIASEVARAAARVAAKPQPIPERIVERIVERPLRKRLPDTRRAVTHKFDVGGHEGYITVGLYDDGQPGEVFITMAKEGSTIGGLMDTIATLVSVALQYGVPVESLVRKFEHVRFEPSGMTRNSDIPFAKSIVDYIFRWLAMQFLPGYRRANAPHREETASETPETPAPAAEAQCEPPAAQEEAAPAPKAMVTAAAEPTPSQSTATRQAVAHNPASRQAADLMSDAPACDVCGCITVRSGTCYKCTNCGHSMGCS